MRTQFDILTFFFQIRVDANANYFSSYDTNVYHDLFSGLPNHAVPSPLHYLPLSSGSIFHSKPSSEQLSKTVQHSKSPLLALWVVSQTQFWQKQDLRKLDKTRNETGGRTLGK